MKITITAKSDEQHKVDELLEVLEKARQRHHREAVDLLIPALADAHDRGRMIRDRIERQMWKRIQKVIAE